MAMMSWRRVNKETPVYLHIDRLTIGSSTHTCKNYTTGSQQKNHRIIGAGLCGPTGTSALVFVKVALLSMRYRVQCLVDRTKILETNMSLSSSSPPVEQKAGHDASPVRFWTCRSVRLRRACAASTKRWRPDRSSIMPPSIPSPFGPSAYAFIEQRPREQTFLRKTALCVALLREESAQSDVTRKRSAQQASLSASLLRS